MTTNGLFVYLQDCNSSLINPSINPDPSWILKFNKENIRYFLKDIDLSNNTYNRDSTYIMRNAHISVYETIRQNRDDVFHVTFEIAVIDKAINSGKNRKGKAKKNIRNHDAVPNIVYIHTYFDSNGQCLAEPHLRTNENLSSDKAAQLNAWIDELDISILNNFKALAKDYAQSYMLPIQEDYNFQVAQLKQRCYELNIFSKESWQDYLFHDSEETSEKLNIAIAILTQLVSFNVIDHQHNYQYYLKLFTAMQRWLVAPMIESESTIKDNIEEEKIVKEITIQEDATISSSAKIIQILNEPILPSRIPYQQRILMLYESCQELLAEKNMKSDSIESERDYALMLHEKVENLYVATFNAYDEHNICLDMQQIINSFDLEDFIKQKNTICTNILFNILLEENIQQHAIQNLIQFSVMLSPLQLNILIERGRTHSLKLILDYRCDTLNEDINNITASSGDAEQLNPLLLSAFIYRKPDIFQLLLNKNASPLFDYVNGFSLAHYIITQASSEEHELFAYRLWVQYPKNPNLALGYYKVLYAEITRALQDNSLNTNEYDSYRDLQEEYALHIMLAKQTNALTKIRYNNAFITEIKSKFLSKVHEKLKKYRLTNFEKFSKYITSYAVENTDLELFQKMRKTHNLLLRLTIEDLKDTSSYYDINQKLLELQMGCERWEELMLLPNATINDRPALNDKRTFLRNYCEQTASEMRIRFAEYNSNFSDMLEKMFQLLERNGVAQRKRNKMYENIITKYNAHLAQCKQKILYFSRQYNNAVQNRHLNNKEDHIFEELFELIHAIEYDKKSMNLFCRDQYKEYHKLLLQNRQPIPDNIEIPIPFTIHEIPEDLVSMQNQVSIALI